MTSVYCGACQYYVGDYLNHPWHDKQLARMIGNRKRSDVIFDLNSLMPDIIRQHKGSNTIINLFYSKEEHTYSEHIVHLIKDLDDNNIIHYDFIENFQNHSDIAIYFPTFLKRKLTT